MLQRSIVLNFFLCTISAFLIESAFAQPKEPPKEPVGGPKSEGSIVGKFLIVPKCACLPPQVSVSPNAQSTAATEDSGTTSYATAQEAQTACDKVLATVRIAKRDEVNDAVLAEVRKACTKYKKVDPECGDKAKACRAVDTSGYSLDQITTSSITCVIGGGGGGSPGKYYFNVKGMATYNGTFDVLCDP